MRKAYSAKVIIMLASYNGEKYIREQLDSIINNDYKNISLVISDDCSIDNTWSILEEYAKRYSFITLIVNKSGKHGAIYNFANLVKFVKEHQEKNCFYMFSDQDDVWLPNKISVSVEAIKHKRDGSVLVYTGKQYVNKKLQYIFEDTKEEHFLDINIIHQNKSYGCTYIFNSELLARLESDIPHDFINYDHYVAAQAFLNGIVCFLPQKTILYRQHGDNVSGTINKKITERMCLKKKYKQNILLYKFMIDYFWNNRSLLSSSEYKIIEELHKCTQSRMRLFISSLKNKIQKNTFLGSMQFYLSILVF